MKQLLFLFLTFLSFSGNAQNSVSLQKVVDSIESVLKEISLIEIKNDKPQPKKVILTFESEISKETEGGIKILFFKVGRKKSTTKSSETSFEYEVTPIQALDATLTKSLSIAIRNAYEEILKTNSNRLNLKGFVVKVSFSLEKSKSLSGEYELSPITPSLNKGWSKKAVHTIEVVFE